MPRPPYLFAVVLGILCNASPAAVVSWEGDSPVDPANWMIGENWTGGSPPTYLDIAVIENSRAVLKKFTVINGLQIDHNGVMQLDTAADLRTPWAVLGSRADSRGRIELNGDRFFMLDAAESLTLGQAAGGVGEFELQSGLLSVGYSPVSPGNVVVGLGGSGHFAQTGGDHTVHNDLVLAALPGSQGVYSLSGGRLNFHDGVMRIGEGHGQFLFTGGELAYPGRIEFSLVNDGGVFIPGSDTVVTGDYAVTSPEAALMVVLDDPPGSRSFTHLQVDGNASLEGVLRVSLQVPGLVFGDTDGDGEVDLSDLNNVRNHFGEVGDNILGDGNQDGVVDLDDLNAVRNNIGDVYQLYYPAAGDSFEIVTAKEIVGAFSAVELPTLTPGLAWELMYTENTVRLDVIATNPVPEPSSVILCSVALVALGWTRRTGR